MSKALALLMVLMAAGCGNSIGDSCAVSSDCSSEGDRICDVSSPGGYCTVLGCDFDTCPEEAVCVRFFAVTDSTRVCTAETEDQSTDDCSPDELCTLRGVCVPRGAELRYCMLSCSSDSDCRSGYECRDTDLMLEHGGEPVLKSSAEELPKFCAAEPVSR